MRVHLQRAAPSRNLPTPTSVSIEDVETRTKFYGFNLGQLGIPLFEALTPKLSKITFNGEPLGLGSNDAEEQEDPFADRTGFSSTRCFAEGCLGWTFCQWHMGTPKEEIRGDFVRGRSWNGDAAEVSEPKVSLSA